MEQSFCRRHGGQRQNLGAAAGLAEQSYVIWIAAEFCNVFMYPLQRRHNIQNSGVTGFLIFFPVCGKIQKAQGVQPVVHRYHHHVALAAEVFSVINVFHAGGTGEIAAAMEPHHDRTFLPVFNAGGPDVQVLAVFTLLQVPGFPVGPVPVGREDIVLLVGELGRYRRVIHGGFDSGPGFYRLRFLEPFRLRVLHALVIVNPFMYIALQRSGFCFRHRHAGPGDHFAHIPRVGTRRFHYRRRTYRKCCRCQQNGKHCQRFFAKYFFTVRLFKSVHCAHSFF